MPGNVRPVANTGIDLELLQDWHEFCQDKGLHYNRVLDQTGVTLGEVRAEIAVAGRASPRHDGRRLGVVIDRPAELVVDHVNPRNSWNFTMRRSYVDLPHAFITKFQDQDNDYKEAERVIRRPGYEGDITITETLDQPGLTSAPIVYREGVRRFYEAIHRPDVFEVTQDGALRVATRGDKVALNSYVLSRVQTVGRVRYLAGSLIELDEEVTMEPGRAYGVRFRAFETPDDTIGNSVVRTVSTVPGKTTVLNLTGAGPMPELRELVHFGIIGADSFELLVTGLEPTEDGCTILRSVNAAPIIDTLTDAAEIPPWSSRVGEELDPNMLQPSAPRFTRIASGIVGVGELGVVEYMSEIQTLQWAFLTDAGMELPDTKTGARRIPLPHAARAVLDSLPSTPGNPYVIEGKLPGQYASDLQHPWRRIRAKAGLPDVRIHDLRHTYASNAVSSGMPIQMVGRLLGHTQLQTTMRYAHLADDPVRRAAEENAARLNAALGIAPNGVARLRVVS